MKMILATLFTAITVTASPSFAQSEVLVVSQSDIHVMPTSEAEARLAALEQSYQDVKTWPPQAGLGVSAVLMAGGAFMMTIGISYNRFCVLSDEQLCQREPAGTGMAVAGAVALLGGIAGLAVSSVRLRRAKEKKRALEPEIEALRQALP
jgi:hypothetical protein